MVIGVIPKANSQVTISQVETSRMCNFPSGNFPGMDIYVPRVRLDLLRRRATGCNGGRPDTAVMMGWGGLIAAALGNTQLRGYHLGKYPWEAVAWAKALEKVPNIVKMTSMYTTTSLQVNLV